MSIRREPESVQDRVLQLIREAGVRIETKLLEREPDSRLSRQCVSTVAAVF